MQKAKRDKWRKSQMHRVVAEEEAEEEAEEAEEAAHGGENTDEVYGDICAEESRRSGAPSANGSLRESSLRESSLRESGREESSPAPRSPPARAARSPSRAAHTLAEQVRDFTKTPKRFRGRAAGRQRSPIPSSLREAPRHTVPAEVQKNIFSLSLHVAPPLLPYLQR